MQNRKTVIWLLLLLLATMQAHAQRVTLKQLLQQVNQRSPELQTDSAAILVRRAQATETRNSWLPNLKLNYQADLGTNNNDAGPYFGYGIVPSDSRGVRTSSVTTASSTTLGVASLDWEIYNFGAYRTQNKVANADIEVQQGQFEQSKYQLQAFTIDNYLQLLHLHNFLAIQLSNIQRNEEIKRSVMSLAKSGVRPGVDTSIAEAELSKARLGYIELLNQSKQIQLQLSAISGIPYQNINPDTAISQTLLNNIVPMSLNDADTANHPLINYYRSIYADNLQRESLVKKSYNPKIMLEGATWGRGSSIDANDNFNALSNGLGFNRDNYLIGIGISYNLTDLRRRRLKLLTQKSQTNYARKKLEEETQQISLDNQQANQNLRTARQRLKEIPNQLNAATAGYRQKLSLYKNGLTDIIELNAALNILYRAETDYAAAKYAYLDALFQKAIAQNQVNNILNLLN